MIFTIYYEIEISISQLMIHLNRNMHKTIHLLYRISLYSKTNTLYISFNHLFEQNMVVRTIHLLSYFSLQNEIIMSISKFMNCLTGIVFKIHQFLYHFLVYDRKLISTIRLITYLKRILFKHIHVLHKYHITK